MTIKRSGCNPLFPSKLHPNPSYSEYCVYSSTAAWAAAIFPLYIGVSLLVVNYLATFQSNFCDTSQIPPYI